MIFNRRIWMSKAEGAARPWFPGWIALMGVIVAASPVHAQIPFEVLGFAQRAFSGTSEHVQVARNAQELRALWTDLRLPGDSPELNFKRTVVVAYYLGPRADSGYGIGVDAVRVESGVMRVHVRELNYCGGHQFPSSPAILIKTIPWRRGVESDRRLVPGCSQPGD